MAIPRAVSCFTRPTTCELLPDFLSTFASPGDFDEWNGGTRCIGAADEKKARPTKREISRKIVAVSGRRQKGRAAARRKGEPLGVWEIIGRSVRGV